MQLSIIENLKKGTTELLLLLLLSKEDMYGYQLSQEIAVRSGQLFLIREGSMYPILYRMMDKGYISDRKEKVGVRRVRVYYHLEEKGRKYLKQVKNEYESIHKGISLVIRSVE